MAAQPAPSTESIDRLLTRRPSALDVILWRFGGVSRTVAVGPSDFSLGLVGLAFALCVGLIDVFVFIKHSHQQMNVAVACLVLLRVLAIMYPLRLGRSRVVSELRLDAPLLAYWLLTVGPYWTVFFWLVGALVGELLVTHVLAVAALNTGVAAVSAAVAAAAFLGAPALHPPGQGLVPVLAAGLALVVVDLALTAAGTWVMAGRRATPRQVSLQVGAAVLASTILVLPGWAVTRIQARDAASAAILAVVSVTAIALACAIGRLAADRQRTNLVVRFLHRMHGFPDEDAAFRELELTARELMSTPDVVVRAWPPAPARREVGYSLDGTPSRHRPAEGPGNWVVARIRTLDRGFHPDELVALETLATVAGAGFSNRRSTDQTAWLATHDVLTRLANRAHLLDRMLLAERAPEARAGRDSAVVLIDIDGFKGVNDNIGHDAGDHVLAVLGPRIGEVLYDTIGAAALASRLGGDEFALFLPAVSSAVQVQAACEAIRERIKEPIDWHQRKLHLDASIGFSMGPQILATSLIREADAAMYQVKHSGKGGIARYMLAASSPAGASGS